MMTTDQLEVRVLTEQNPIKTNGEFLADPALITEQAEAARDSLVDVDYFAVPGTCSDERAREGILSGEPLVEARPSVLGGPTVYGLAVAELTGFFGEAETAGEARLATVAQRLEDVGILNGGHIKCAANAGFESWMRIMAEHPELVVPYVEKEMGTRFDPITMAEVVHYAGDVVASGRYGGWSEEVLPRVLGDKSGSAIEKLRDVPHDGMTLVRQKVDGKTVDQTTLYERSVLGRGSFVFDDPYADLVEHAMTTGPDAARKKVVAEHAREAIIAAIAVALPNPELYQITLI